MTDPSSSSLTTLLRLSPLFTSSFSLMFAFDHDLFFRVFTYGHHRPRSHPPHQVQVQVQAQAQAPDPSPSPALLSLSPTQQKAYTLQINSIIPPWTKIYMPRGLRVILALYPTTLLLALANIYLSSSSPPPPPSSSSRSSDSADRAAALQTARWYWAAGAAGTVGHVALFGRRAVELLTRMRDANDADTDDGTREKERGKETEEEEQEDRGRGATATATATADMRAWIRMNVWRVVCVDAPAWGFYLLAALSALRAV